MSPRPKRTPDADIILVAARVITERGAARTRLADVAAASGFAAATLIQRFGTRERLLQAVGEAYTGGIRRAFTAAASSSLDRLAEGLKGLASQGHPAFLLAFPDAGPSYSLELRKWIGYTLVAAIEAGELPPCDVANHARRLQLAYYGLTTAALIESDLLSAEAFSSLVRDVMADFI